MTTKIGYMYRDASNYKQYREVVFPGVITDAEHRMIVANLDDHSNAQEFGFFLPEQVGLPVLYQAWGTGHDDDHPWHELLLIEVRTDRTATETETIGEFAKRFDNITWDETTATEQVGEFVAAHPAPTETGEPQ